MKQLTQYSKVQYSLTKLGGGQTQTGVSFPGGLDLTTPSLALQPGALRAAQNFECSQSGGYGRIAGYERFDGHQAPSAAGITVVQFAGFTSVPNNGDLLRQAVSLASGTVVSSSNVTGAFYVVLTQVSGTFDTSHSVTDTTTSRTVGVPIPQTVVITPKQQAQYTAAAANVYRALIGAVPGSGTIVDVYRMTIGGADTVFALRPNSGNTALAMYKSSSSGWVLVPFFNTVQFTGGGTVVPADGATLTQGGVTATVKRVMQFSGTWAGGTAAGQFVITNPAGGNFASGSATLTGGATVTLSGVQVAISPSVGGKGQHDKGNFFGQPNTIRVYGCDGVNPPYEFDGTTYAPIKTGLSPNQPTNIRIHKNYLVLSQGGSLIGSAPALPYDYSGADGAWEIACGDTITGMITLPGSQTTATLAVFEKSNTSFLYGLDVTSFNFITFNQGMGGLQYSVQNLYDTFVFDPLGVVTLQTTLNWGNFLPAALTKNIIPFVLQERNKLTASSINRTKSQYRSFFSDGYGLYVTLVNKQYLGSIPVLFPNPVSCIDTDYNAEGSEVCYFGSSDGQGFIYQLDSGNTFDGVGVSAFATMAWDALKTPRILKRFRACSFELQATSYTEFSFSYQIGYDSANYGQPPSITSAANFSPAFTWDNFTWDAGFVWDGQTLMPTDADLQGTAENIQISIGCNADYVAPFQLNSAIYHYSLRRGMRV